ncbi:hypothetical protein Nwat_1396 [Nitrosococcus watsonii C-113]|nr:hypothetical protein Nwat_1396 [Nitrosococcus watsonii C-113]
MAAVKLKQNTPSSQRLLGNSRVDRILIQRSILDSNTINKIASISNILTLIKSKITRSEVYEMAIVLEMLSGKACPSVHPHACGERGEVEVMETDDLGSSPRLWGTDLF